jgi:aryl-alcohol dehydrogenase-like predicted oxidoreductase
MAFLPFFPLANGMLTGKYRRGQAPPKGSRIESGWHDELLTGENIDIIEDLVDYAATHSHTILELAFSWLLAKPMVASVIAGATSPDQVRANAHAGSWELTDDQLKKISAIAPLER